MTDLTPIKSEVDEFLYNFQDVQITTVDEYTNAGDILKQIQQKIKKLETKRLEYTRPLDESKKRIMDDFKEVTTPLEEFVSTVKGKMLDWYKKDQARRNEEQARIEAQALEEAKKTNTSEVIVPVVNEEKKTQKGDVATITVKKVWKWKIVDESKIPKDYFIVDTKKLDAAIKEGVRVIDGVEIFQEEQAPSIR